MRSRSATKRPPVQYEAAAVPKNERVKDPEHLDRVRAMPCQCSFTHPAECGGWSDEQLKLGHPSEAAHLDNKGWAKEAGDDRVLNICPNHHRKKAYSWHVAGRKRFQEKYGWNAEKHSIALYDETLRLRGKETP